MICHAYEKNQVFTYIISSSLGFVALINVKTVNVVI